MDLIAFGEMKGIATAVPQKGQEIILPYHWMGVDLLWGKSCLKGAGFLEFQNLFDQWVDFFESDKDFLLGFALKGDSDDSRMDQFVHAMEDFRFGPNLSETCEILEPPFGLGSEFQEAKELKGLV